MENIRLVIVDDHQVMIDGLVSIFENQDDIEVIGASSDPIKGVEIVKSELPDVVLMDLRMPVLDGFRATEIIKEECPEVKVVVLSMHNDPESIAKATENGAEGYILKNAGKQEILMAIKSVHAGRMYFSNEVSTALIEGIKILRQKPEKEAKEKLELQRRRNEADQLLSVISKCERQILKMLCDDKKTTEIAEELGRSVFTIDTHKKRIFKKFEVSSMSALIKLAYEMGIIEVLNDETLD